MRVGAAAASFLSLVGVALAITGGVKGWPVWTVTLLVALCLAAAFVAATTGSPRPPSQRASTAFILGDVERSSLDTVDSDADNFITGSVRDSWTRRITHRSSGRRRWWSRGRR